MWCARWYLFSRDDKSQKYNKWKGTSGVILLMPFNLRGISSAFQRAKAALGFVLL